MPEEKKKKPGVMNLVNGALFIVAVLTGLFVHYSVALYNWLTVAGFIILAIYFSRREKPLRCFLPRCSDMVGSLLWVIHVNRPPPPARVPEEDGRA